MQFLDAFESGFDTICMKAGLSAVALVACVGCTNTLTSKSSGTVPTSIERACAASPGEQPVIAGISIRDEPAVPGDLAAMRVTSEATGAFMRVYYDAGSESIARARAACLGAQLPMIERETGDTRRGVEWWSAVFTQNPAYIPPRGEGIQPRWRVNVQPDGNLSPSGRVMVVSTLPHEHVHAYQTRAGARPPQWVAEGHASWVQGKIAPLLNPAIAQTQHRLRMEDAAKGEGPLNLAQWGSRRPKREAKMRQVSPEIRARMEADPTFNPTGTFTFKPEDFEGDTSNTSGQYLAAEAIFDGLEARHGAGKVRTWMTELTASSDRITPQSLAESIERHFDENISDLLAEPEPGAQAQD